MRVKNHQAVEQARGLPPGRRASPQDPLLLPCHADREAQDQAGGQQEGAGRDRHSSADFGGVHIAQLHGPVQEDVRVHAQVLRL